MRSCVFVSMCACEQACVLVIGCVLCVACVFVHIALSHTPILAPTTDAHRRTPCCWHQAKFSHEVKCWVLSALEEAGFAYRHGVVAVLSA